ncbi:aldehyde dehydrogenase family protein [Metallosphaera hakonensis]|uniref:Aldehyde dehydrogenase n=1 Tax=Metallosphaera hakonensis JCM 8857 = DSM 7519 TaxID=1293036 RepID=A0A2U9IV54_9CREN|nr:aldehyde dehydrogenase family protein [Metallosphaera hakonensis]AWR99929.1 aldehyde dehydrogenase family protein [Metallosphaera hakonensis JCM 8857 = DSM 7519]
MIPIILGGEKVFTQDKVDVVNPGTGRPFKEISLAGRDETRHAIELAEESFHEFSRMPLSERTKILWRTAGLMEERREELAVALASESGKPIRDARVEVTRAIQLFKSTAEEAKVVLEGKTFRVDGYEYPPGNERRLVLSVREPLGVIGAILPFNFPANSFAHKVAPNLAVGNTVVVKPSTSTPFTSLLLGEILYEAGLPKGVLSVLPGSGDLVGTEIVENKKVKGITFTGSTPVGTSIASKAVLSGKRLMMEMGGSDPILIFEDADLERAVTISVKARFEYAGQNCNSGKRILVHDKIYEKFVREYVSRAKALRVGDPMNEETEVGPLISAKAVNEMEDAVRDSSEKGGKIYVGNKGNGGFYFPPTVVENANLDMVVMKKEIFGPVAPISKFSTWREAVDMANSTEYGLQAAVFTSNLKLALNVARELKAGAVIVNDSTRLRWDSLPFGGVGLSGLGGREGIRSTMLTMSEEKLISVDLE